jgi:hypothetical protein
VQELRRVEFEIFSKEVKPKLIQKELWAVDNVSQVNQRAADKEVADTIWRSLHVHEVTAKKKPDTIIQYFKF